MEAESRSSTIGGLEQVKIMPRTAPRKLSASKLCMTDVELLKRLWGSLLGSRR